MEKRIPVTNNTNMNLYVGSNIVPPGETRDFPEHQVPHHLRPAAEQPIVEPPAPAADPLAELLEGNVASVVAALPALSAEEIERLGELEQAGQARKGVLGPVAETLLARAAAAQWLEQIAGMDDDALMNSLANIGGDADPDYVAALEAEVAKRSLALGG